MMLRYYSATAAATLLLMLSGRDMLLATNLFDNGLGLREKETVTCDERSLGARTEDGTCNDKKIPLMGAVDVPLGRNVDPKEVVKTQKHLLSPNPILLSRTLMSRESEGSEFKVKELPLNLLVTAWIQFQNHDWFDHSNTELDRTSYIKVPIPAPYRKDFALGESDVFGNILEDLKGLAGLNEFMLVPKTKVVGTRKDSNGQSYEIFSNRVTHWWDGSQIYGSNVERAHDLRTMKGGLMKLDPNSKLLPLAESDQDPVTSAHGYQTGYLAGVEKTGFVENWWTGMSLLHNLFTRNHNAIASDREFIRQTKELLAKSEAGRELKEGTPEYEAALDQMLYDKARLVNSAIIAKIHSVDWTPAAFDTAALEAALRANWHGILEGQLDKNVKGAEFWHAVKNAATQVGLTELTKNIALFGIVGGKKSLGPNNVPFTITEEFTTVYRLHSLLPENLKVYDTNGGSLGTKPLKETRLTKSAETLKELGFGGALYSFGRTEPGNLVLNNFPHFLQSLDVPVVGKLDMAAIDILRDRERGVPRYNAFRRALHLAEITSFPDLFVYDSRVKLNVSPDECETLPNDLTALGSTANEKGGKGRVAQGLKWVAGALSRRGYDRKITQNSEMGEYTLKHCRIQKMYGRFIRWRDLTTSGATAAQGADEIETLAKQVKADLAEREAAVAKCAECAEAVKHLRTAYNDPKLGLDELQLTSQKALGLSDNVEALDMLVGTHAETARPPAQGHRIGYGLGETQFQLFILMASRRLFADRFFNEDYKPDVYTQRGLDIVASANMKGVLACNAKREFPRIREALKCIRSGFHPFNDLSGTPDCSKTKPEYERREQQLMDRYTEMCGS